MAIIVDLHALKRNLEIEKQGLLNQKIKIERSMKAIENQIRRIDDKIQKANKEDFF